MSWQQFFRDSISVSTAINTYNTSKNLENIDRSIQDFKEQSERSLNNISASINKGFAKLSLELALQSKIFANILTVLKDKRKVEAEELKNFGIEALRNGWIEEAIADFLKSIELNRYDYQVYFLLSKCFFIQENYIEQENYLKKAFKYSSVDLDFQQYVLFDIIGKLISDQNWIEAREIIQRYEYNIKLDQLSVPILLSKLSVNFQEGLVNDESLSIISFAIDKYEADEPSRIVEVIELLSKNLPVLEKQKVDQKINAKKFVIAKKFGINLMTSINNIEASLIFLKNSENESLIKSVPKSVIKRFFPIFNEFSSLLNDINSIKLNISNFSNQSFEQIRYISSILQKLDYEIIETIKKLYAKKDKGSFNSEPFKQPWMSQKNIAVDSGDKVLIECVLNDQRVITLSYFKLIISNNTNSTYYDLYDEFLNVQKEDIRIDEISFQTQSTDLITFYLRDLVSKKIILFSSSKMVTSQYGSSEKYANVLDLLWSRATNNLIICLNLSLSELSLQKFKKIVDYLNELLAKEPTKELDSNTNIDDIEFLND